MRLSRPRWTVRRSMIVVALAAVITWLVMVDLRLRQTINAPDIIEVNVATALPGRPITGERLVRPDGTTSLGYYGQVYVDGLLPRQARAKIVEHLRQYLSDEDLGLVEHVQGRDGRVILRKLTPGETDRVSVVITSKNYPGGLINLDRMIWQIRNLPRRIGL